MGAKVTADPDTRIIDLTEAPTGGFASIRVVEDIYSDLKQDWLQSAALQRLMFPFEPTGGDAISATENVGGYVFLRNGDGWRLRPYDDDHELRLIGNIFARTSSSPLWLNRPGRTVTIQVERSSLAISLPVMARAGIR